MGEKIPTLINQQPVTKLPEFTKEESEKQHSKAYPMEGKIMDELEEGIAKGATEAARKKAKDINSRIDKSIERDDDYKDRTYEPEHKL